MSPRRMRYYCRHVIDEGTCLKSRSSVLGELDLEPRQSVHSPCTATCFSMLNLAGKALQHLVKACVNAESIIFAVIPVLQEFPILWSVLPTKQMPLKRKSKVVHFTQIFLSKGFC